MLQAAIVIAVLSMAGLSVGLAAESPAESAHPMVPPNSVSGYLSAPARLNSVALVPEPPTAGTPAVARDEDVSRSALEMHGTQRWEQAIRDAELTFPSIAEGFSCALNVSISDERTPRLMTLLRRTRVDAGRSTSEAKQRYQRQRPFMINGKPMCTPDREAALRADGSYPSGHGAIGWAFGLVLSELAPERANELLARGRDFGQSRLVCNVHWQSDVLEGQMMGAAVVARLHAEPAFRGDMEAARAELEAVRTRAVMNPDSCKLETEALQSWR